MIDPLIALSEALDARGVEHDMIPPETLRPAQIRIKGFPAIYVATHMTVSGDLIPEGYTWRDKVHDLAPDTVSLLIALDVETARSA